MKKFGYALVSLTLILCMALSGALAADVTVFPQEDGVYRYVNNCAAVGDTLYFLVETDNGMHIGWWKDGMTDGEMSEDALINARQFSTAEDMEGVEGDTAHAVGAFFSDGERLLGMNPVTGLVFQIAVDGGKTTFTDLLTVKDTQLFMHVSDGYSYIADTAGTAVVDETLLYVVQDWDDQTGVSKNRLLLIDLKTGEVKQSQVEFVQGVTAYKDGKALLRIYDDSTAYDEKTSTWTNPTLAVFDLAGDSAQEMGKYPIQSPSGMAYSASLDALLYMEGSRIMGLQGLTEPKQYGYAPVDYCDKLLTVGDNAVVCNYSGTFIRTLTADFATDQFVNVYGGYMDNGSKLFSSRYPSVPVYFNSQYYSDIEQISQAMVSGDNAVDVLNMSVGYQPYLTLRDKGYCADLSAYPELVDFVKRTYPALQDVLMKDGKLYAIPTNVYSWGWFSTTHIMEEMGLTQEDLPTNYVDLCAFLTRWNDEWVDEYPNYTPLSYVTDYKQSMFSLMMNDYLNYCTSQKQEVKFDTPVFRQMMQALEQMRVDELDATGSDAESNDYDYRESLLQNGNQVVGDFSISINDYMTLIPMTLTADTPYVIGLDMQVTFVNPKSAHMEAAVNLLKCQVEGMDMTQQYVMLADMTEPMLNPYYDQSVKSAQEWLETLEKQLAEADDADKKDIQSNIDAQKEYMSTMEEKEKYSITADQLTYYQQQIAPKMFVNEPTFYTGTQNDATSELNTLMERYRQGQISLDQFIKEADNKMRMMQMENN